MKICHFIIVLLTMPIYYDIIMLNYMMNFQP